MPPSETWPRAPTQAASRTARPPRALLGSVLATMGIDPHRADWVQRLPFAPDDVSTGTENELAVEVEGAACDVDLERALAEPRADPQALAALIALLALYAQARHDDRNPA